MELATARVTQKTENAPHKARIAFSLFVVVVDMPVWAHRIGGLADTAAVLLVRK